MTPTSRKPDSDSQSILFARPPLFAHPPEPSPRDNVPPEVEAGQKVAPKASTKTGAKVGTTAGEWITAYTDGGSRGNPGPAGYGVVLQTDDAKPLAELSEFLGIQTNNVAEYSAMLGALQYVLDHGYSRLRVVSDSELMVKQIRGQYSVKSPDLRPLYEEARRRIARLEKFEIQHVLRGKNRHADQLANEAMDRGMKRSSSPAAKSELASSNRPASTKPAAAPASRPEIPIVRADASAASAPARPLRGIVRNGSIQLPENALPEGTVVIIMTEDALRGPR